MPTSGAKASYGTTFRAVVAVGLALLAGGLVITLGLGRTRSFGWFAYQPLPSVEDLPYAIFPGQLWGVLLTALGALLLAGLVGYALGSRRGSTRREPRPSAR